MAFSTKPVMCCVRGWRLPPWILVDDTGARQQAQSGFCTQTGDDRFAWLDMRSFKSRLNFLYLLRAGHTDYILNAAAFGYMRGRGLAAPSIARLTEVGETRLADQSAWQAHPSGPAWHRLTSSGRFGGYPGSGADGH